MTIFILGLSLLIAIIAIVVLMGISPASQKAKVWTMYAGAALMFIAAPVVCGYIDDAVGTLAKSRFYGLLFFTIAVGYLCVAIGCMEKYNVLKRRTRILEEALTEKEQEKVSALLEHQSEKLQAIQTKEIEWLTEKIKMFTDDEQKAILASVLHFAQHDLILPPLYPFNSTNPVANKNSCTTSAPLFSVWARNVATSRVSYIRYSPFTSLLEKMLWLRRCLGRRRLGREGRKKCETV